MLESIRSYLRLSRLAKALHEASQHPFSTQSEATQVCQELVRTTGKPFSVVKDQKGTLFWVVRTASATVLAQEGHTILTDDKK